MCTRDGERFVVEQLTSILEQRRLPDQLVLFDDASTDGTVELAERTLREAPFPTKVTRNDTALGVTANFSAAIAACSGDVIALADQDDVWHANKLERLSTELARDDNVLAVFSDADLIDEDSSAQRRALWRRVGVSRAARRRLLGGQVLEQLVRWKVVTGATLAFRARLVPHLLPMPAGALHDTWIAVMAALLGDVVAVPDPLLCYRVHDANAVGLPSRDPRVVATTHADDTDARADELAMFELAVSRAAAAGADSQRLALVERKIRFLEQRAALDAKPVLRIAPVARGLVTGRYHALGHGARSAGHDLVYGR